MKRDRIKCKRVKITLKDNCFFCVCEVKNAIFDDQTFSYSPGTRGVLPAVKQIVALFTIRLLIIDELLARGEIKRKNYKQETLDAPVRCSPKNEKF